MKGKGKVLPAKARGGGGPQRRPSNPFEIKKTKTRFDTVGRRLKGSTKNVVRAREQAIDKRDKTLLVEYRQLRKSNNFVDRRFGESNSHLTDDDKAFARMRTQRLKAKRTPLGGGKKAKFALGGDDGDDVGLTHGGKALSELDDLGEAPDMDDIDDEIYEEVMKDYNFGGGEDSEVAKGPDGKPKTRKQVIEEIIARSKAHKAERQRQKEEDLETMKQLDDDYRTLLKSQALAAFVKPKGHDKDNKVKAATQDDAEYDVAARELAFEGKGQASDRTLTPEELAEKQRQLLEQMEKQRLQRMRGGLNDDEQDLGPAPGVPTGGYAARRAKQRAKTEGKDGSGDEDGEDEGEDQDEDEEEGGGDDDGQETMGGDEDAGTQLERRRMSRAAGSHPLQSALREKAAELAAKYGLGKVRNPMMEEEDEDGDSEDSDGDEGEEGESGDEGDAGSGDGDDTQGSEGESEDEGEDDDEGDAYEQELKALQGPQEARRGMEVPTAKVGAGEAGGAQGGAAAAAEPELAGPIDIPFTIPVPETYEAFAKLVAGRQPDELALVVQRIRAFNAADLATDSKRKLQVFYGILVQHFAALAGELPVPVAHLDATVPLLVQSTSEVPYYAATVARARLARMHERLSASLSGNPISSVAQGASGKQGGKAGAKQPPQQQQQVPESAWPAPRALLQLKLFASLFPTSDRRHPVLTPALLLTCRALSQCTATDVGEVVRGLVLCGLALHMTAPANRHCPEPSTFLTHVLLSFCGAAAKEVDGDVPRRVVPGLLAPAAKGQSLSKVTPAQVGLMQALTLPAGASAKSSPTPSGTPAVDDALKLGLLQVTMQAVGRTSDVACACHRDGYPEATQGLRAALALLGSCLKLPQALEEQRVELLAKMERTAAQATSQRKPLVRIGGAKIIREFNPRFEDGYVKGHDYDPDRERAEQRRLKKEMAKERRGAIRELRRDAAYMAEVRDRERSQVDAERMDSQRKFYSELQKQQADLNSGGQGGMNPHLKKRRKK